MVGSPRYHSSVTVISHHFKTVQKSMLMSFFSCACYLESGFILIQILLDQTAALLLIPVLVRIVLCNYLVVNYETYRNVNLLNVKYELVPQLDVDSSSNLCFAEQTYDSFKPWPDRFLLVVQSPLLQCHCHCTN